MPPFPISVPRQRYRGSNLARKRKAAALDRIAEKLETYINEKMAKSDEDRCVFIYGMMAVDLGIAESQVRDALYGIAGGTGVTVWKPK